MDGGTIKKRAERQADKQGNVDDDKNDGDDNVNGNQRLGKFRVQLIGVQARHHEKANCRDAKNEDDV